MLVLLMIMGIYEMIPWANRGYGTLDISTSLYSLAMLLGGYDQRWASKGERDV